MDSLHTADLGGKRVVIGLVETADAIRNIGFGRRLAVLPDRKPVKVGFRDQRRGVLAGIEADAFRVAIGVDAIAVEGGANHGRAFEDTVIKPVDVPVGIGENPAIFIEARPDVAGNIRARVRKAQNDGRRALPDFKGAQDQASSDGRMPPETAPASTPSATRSAAFLRSSAM